MEGIGAQGKGAGLIHTYELLPGVIFNSRFQMVEVSFTLAP